MPQTNNHPTLMELRDVVYSYRRHRLVLDRVNVKVQSGLVHVLIGPSGSGKSTLLGVMLGRLRPWRGRVLYGGRRLGRLSPARRAAVMSYVPPGSGAAFGFTVRRVVEMGRFALPADPEAVDRAIAACNLTALAGRPYGELSADRRQRVLLARAMAQAAGGGRVMLLDEPTGAMDPPHAHRAMNHLRWLAERGMAVAAVVGDLNLAARYADRVWVMDGGRLVADGPWNDVLTPEILDPIYGMEVEPLAPEPGGGRPRFDLRLPPVGNPG